MKQRGNVILIVLLLLLLLGGLPLWPHAQQWGWYPSGGIGLVLILIVILALAGKL